MDYAACNIVYVDRTAQEEKLHRREDVSRNHLESRAIPRSSSLVDENLRMLLATFSEVHVCVSGKSCIAKLSELNQSSIAELIPTLVLIDIPYDDQSQDTYEREVCTVTRTPSPTRLQAGGIVDSACDDDLHINHDAYGLRLLQWIVSEVQYQSLSRLIVPIAVVSVPDHGAGPVVPIFRTNSKLDVLLTYTSYPISQKKRAGLVKPLDQIRTVRYLDSGAVDVLTSPLLPERISSLAIHAYRAHKNASKEHRALIDMKRGRKRSWVGVDEQKPYAYLREAMVSGLMDGICKLDDDAVPDNRVRISISLQRREVIAGAIGSWDFSAHDFTDDELLHAALLILQHALTMPELEPWRMSTDNITSFLVASRSAYNAFVPYHNFRHVVDVLQACFHFLVRLGRLPPYSNSIAYPESMPSPIADLIRPFDALTLLITAIGHDVGHPGVNNAFLVTLNAPLAQLYNDRSVLESFHCAAYSQILRRHWPAAFQASEMRQLMISTILATDMGLHFDYMKKLGWMQEKLHENGGIDGWNGRLLDEQKTLACSLLIKCADISNVARKYDVASQWTMILTDEFARQASMEGELGIPSSLFTAPVREIVELGKSQIGFMNMFAFPLFQGVTDVMPAMSFCVDELQQNKAAWEEKISGAQNTIYESAKTFDHDESTLSPRTISLASPSEAISPPSPLLLPAPENTEVQPYCFNGASDGRPIDVSPLPDSATKMTSRSLTPEPASSSVSSIDRSLKPLQLQMSFATNSTTEVLDHICTDTQLSNLVPNDTSVRPSLVTDAVPAHNDTFKAQGLDKGRSSDGTEGGSSAVGDWASQATSATTGKMPLSPSTQGTSVTSDSESVKNNTNSDMKSRNQHALALIRARAGGNSSSQSNSKITDVGLDVDGVSIGTEDDSEHVKTNGGMLVVQKVRELKKRPSRFRMNFWKRSKSSSPPALPVGGGREEGEGVIGGD